MGGTSLPFMLLRLLLALAAFVAPGALWADWLSRGRLGRLASLALGFALSFALFGLVGWPFLWFRRAFAEFLTVLYPVWGLFALSVIATRVWPANRPLAPSDVTEDRPRVRPLAPARIVNRTDVLRVAAYLCMVIGALYLYAYAPSKRSILLRLFPLLLLVGFYCARSLRRLVAQGIGDSSRDHAAPPRLWTVTAAAAIALQVVSIALWNRPDWDDCYYLAAVLDYEQAPQLNAEEPSHREGLPVPAQHRTLCWELFGAVLCRLSGCSPLSLYHTLLPVVLLLLAYAAYATLLRELLPRRYVPLGLLALSALHLWGISSHGAAANFLLPRLGQAKSVLLHLATPLSITLLLRYATDFQGRILVALAGTVLCALALSLSAIFVTLGLLGLLGLALFLTAATTRNRLALAVAIGLLAAPLLAAGLLMRAAIGHEVGLSARPVGSSEWLETLENFLGWGTAELLWFLTLPIVAVLIRQPRQRAYLLWFPLLSGLLLLNPLLFHTVAGSLTSYHTYPRLYWLLPVGPGLAALLALLCRGVARFVDGDSASAGALHRPLGIALLLLFISLPLPGMYVFGARNSFIGPLGTPSLSRNLEKVPPGLLPIADELVATPDITAVRILCDEQIASFLSPYSRVFRFVQTRSLYTPVLFSSAGRTDEGIERALLASILRRGHLSQTLERDELLELRLLFGDDGVEKSFGDATHKASRDLPTLLTRYRVRYVISGPGDHQDLPALLLASGFTRQRQAGDFTLWRRGESSSAQTRFQ